MNSVRVMDWARRSSLYRSLNIATLMTISPIVNSEGWKATIESLVLIYKPITPAQIVMATLRDSKSDLLKLL